MRTSELTLDQLNYAVAKVEGALFRLGDRNDLQVKMPDAPGYLPSVWQNWDYFNPSTNWAHGGPIIEREGIQLHVNELRTEWLGSCWGYPNQAYAPTPLVAAMRCYVASKLGDEVEIPRELIC